MPASASNTSTKRQLVGSRAVFLYALIATVFIPAILSIGEGGPTASRVLTVILIVLNSAWIPIVYLAGAFGLGRVTRKWLEPNSTRWVIELGVGLTLTLSLTHLLGILSMLNPITAWILTGIGCLLFLFNLNKNSSTINQSIGRTKLTLSGLIFVLGSTLVVLMSCNPPGSLWDTEFGSYDSLSYHLELPREWLESGRIEPVAHNVYSFLPSYIESAYLHFAHLANAQSFVANEARITFAASLFSALLLIISAIAMRSLVDRAIKVWNIAPETQADPDRIPAMIARLILVCTPWLIVVGSLAYNEMGVVLLGICALTCAIEVHDSSSNRSLLCICTAFIIAGACSCKPTALFLLAPSVAAVLLAGIPTRQWLKPIAIAIIVGTITLAPWLIRNELAAGNPVFPQLSSLFGDGQWTDAQHTIYKAAHTFEGTLFDRLAMLVVPDSNSTHPILRFRGYTNIQWALTPLLGFLATLILISRKRTRKTGTIIALGIAFPTIAWIMLTHLQSRFLIPIAPVLILALGLAFASITKSNLRDLLARLVALLAFAWTSFIAANQLNANPFAYLVLSTAQFTSELDMQHMLEPSWTNSLNTILEPNDTLYLLGDATPFYLRSPVIYNTVYDHWLIEDAIAAHPNNPQLWSKILADSGVDVVLISIYEIKRYQDSGWLPESIDIDQLGLWIQSLGEPIYQQTRPGFQTPIRAAYRLP